MLCHKGNIEIEQEPIFLERSARLNLDPERGDESDRGDRGERDGGVTRCQRRGYGVQKVI